MHIWKFPNDFIWGTATSSYQIEGAKDVDGKGESIWDIFSHTPGKIINNDNGDIACEHYYKYKDDVALMKKLGIASYRFSISWPRILPEGTGEVNQKGLNFYNDLINELIANNIEPIVTLYHWDLPQALQDKGGWENRETIKNFVEYAEIVFKEYGNKVKKWITHNEPWVVAYEGNAFGKHAPGKKDWKIAVQVAHNVLVSHGLAVKKFRELGMDGEIGITLNLTPSYPVTEDENDGLASKIMGEFTNDWFLSPIFKGKYPEKLEKIYEDMFGEIEIEPDDLEIISTEIDFLGVNYYSRSLVKYSEDSSFSGIETIKSEESQYTAMDWEIYPTGIYDLLLMISNEYTKKPIYITENGAAFDDKIINGEINDENRISYIESHLKELHKAIQSGVYLKGYYAWSLMDNFEWAYGYSKRFGLIYVDYETQKRIWKNSAFFYNEVISNNGIKVEL